MNATHNKIDYIEFGVADIARSKEFYGNVFGWTFTDFGLDYCEFADGRLTSGFTTQSPVRSGGALIITYVDNLEACLSIVKIAGGKITQEIFAFPGGRRFHFSDCDGYELGVWSK